MDPTANFKIVELLPLQPHGKTVIQAFSGSGLVASIVSQQLIKQWNLSLKGYISSSLIPAVGIVREGVIERPIRIYENEKYILIFSEIAIQEDYLVDFIDLLFDWYTHADPANIIVIGALPTGRPANATDLRYNVVTSDEATGNFLQEKGIWTVPQGAVYGSVALSLMEAKKTGISAFCILSHCIATVPDYLAAKKVMELLNAALDENLSVSDAEEHAEELRTHLMNKDNRDDETEVEDFELFEDFEDEYDQDDEDDLSEFI
ncbi:MAG: proteasome assembly chaperone family protein [Candidatus Kariarchaeaceae archaeon]